MSFRREASPNLWAAVVLLIVAVVDLGMAEIYTRIAEQRMALQIYLSTLVVVGLLAMAALLATRRPSAATPGRPWASRLTFAFVVGIAWMGVIGATPDRWWAILEVPWWTRGLVAGVTLSLIVLAVIASAEVWLRARRAAVLAVLLFALTPPMIGWTQAPELPWPRAFDPQSAQADRGRVVTLVVLLDELNARQAGGIVQAIAERGLRTQMAAVHSVAGRTQNTVPSLFAGRPIAGSEPCSPTMSCDAHGATDFARMTATRDDVDVVGFYKPYCHIRGLRSCVRVPVALRLFDTTALRCRLWRRTGWPLAVDDATCKRSGVQDWAAMAEEAVDAARRVPALKLGGLVYLHLPLPHPPGQGVEGSMPQQYQQNVNRAAALLSELIARAQANGLAPRLLVFSDHPLRQSMWCIREPYLSERCVIDPEFDDRQVPVIAAGAEPPDLSALDTNLSVFDLAARLH